MMFILSNSNERIPFDESFPKYATLISEMIKDELEHIEIPIDYSSKTIKLCVEFCKLYDISPFTIKNELVKTNDINDLLPKWCVELLSNLTSYEIFDLMKL